MSSTIDMTFSHLPYSGFVSEKAIKQFWPCCFIFLIEQNFDLPLSRFICAKNF